MILMRGVEFISIEEDPSIRSKFCSISFSHRMIYGGISFLIYSLFLTCFINFARPTYSPVENYTVIPKYPTTYRNR